MKPKRHILAAVLPFLLFVIGGHLILSPTCSDAQGTPSWWGSDRWWDWTDYRASVGVRFAVPQLVSGSVTWKGRDHDLMATADAEGFNFVRTPDFFKEGWFTLYVDRLALRAHFEEDHRFRGLIGTGVYTPVLSIPAEYPGGIIDPTTGTIQDPERFSELDLGWTRFGLDLDLIRYPHLRAGINMDRHYESCAFIDRQGITGTTLQNIFVYDPAMGKAYWVYWADYDNDPRYYTTKQVPVTIGIHGKAVPGRIRGIPLTAEARVRIPMPFLSDITGAKRVAKVTDWEVSVGLRPNIWNTSLYAISSFAMGLDVGYRSTYLDMSSGDDDWQVKAHWHALFVQVGLYY